MKAPSLESRHTAHLIHASELLGVYRIRTEAIGCAGRNLGKHGEPPCPVQGLQPNTAAPSFVHWSLCARALLHSGHRGDKNTEAPALTGALSISASLVPLLQVPRRSGPLTNTRSSILMPRPPRSLVNVLVLNVPRARRLKCSGFFSKSFQTNASMEYNRVKLPEYIHLSLDVKAMSLSCNSS